MDFSVLIAWSGYRKMYFSHLLHEEWEGIGVGYWPNTRNSDRCWNIELVKTYVNEIYHLQQL